MVFGISVLGLAFNWGKLLRVEFRTSLRLGGQRFFVSDLESRISVSDVGFSSDC